MTTRRGSRYRRTHDGASRKEEVIKALTLSQPWGSLLAIGAKKIETRSWKTAYRGPLAIHAAKKYPRAAQMLAISSPFIEPLNRAGYLPDIPLGAVVAMCQLVNCLPVEMVERLSDSERKFGDYSPGRYAWILEDVKLLPEPIPAKGALSLWEWPCWEVPNGQ